MYNHEQERETGLLCHFLTSVSSLLLLQREGPFLSGLSFLLFWVLCVRAVAGTCEFTSVSHNECPTVQGSWMLKQYMAVLINDMQPFYVHIWSSGSPFPIYSSEHPRTRACVEVQIFLRHNFKEQGITLEPFKFFRRKPERYWWSHEIWFFMTLEKPVLTCNFPKMLLVWSHTKANQ